jgi:hypothetical protein
MCVEVGIQNRKSRLEAEAGGGSGWTREGGGSSQDGHQLIFSLSLTTFLVPLNSLFVGFYTFASTPIANLLIFPLTNPAVLLARPPTVLLATFR